METSNENPGTINKIKENIKQNIVAILVGLMILSSGTALYFYNAYSALKQDPNIAVQEEVTKLVAQISKLMALPKGEIPTLATVADPEKLKDQPFFANARKGDKVLIFTNAKKAILYSPESNRIIEVAPIDIGGPKSAPMIR